MWEVCCTYALACSCLCLWASYIGKSRVEYEVEFLGSSIVVVCAIEARCDEIFPYRHRPSLCSTTTPTFFTHLPQQPPPWGCAICGHHVFMGLNFHYCTSNLEDRFCSWLGAAELTMPWCPHPCLSFGSNNSEWINESREFKSRGSRSICPAKPIVVAQSPSWTEIYPTIARTGWLRMQCAGSFLIEASHPEKARKKYLAGDEKTD